MIVIYWYFDSIILRFVIFVISALAIGGFFAYNKYTQSNVNPMIKVFDQYRQHIRFVLLDQGLLAMTLLTNPISNFPNLAKDMNPLGIPTSRSMFDENLIEQRFKLLINHYDLLCWNFRLEPFPPGVPRRKISTNNPPLYRLAKITVAIVLFESLYHEQEETE